MVTRTRMTLEEFLALPGIDEQRLELIDGEVYEKMSPRWGHGEIAGELYHHLRPFGRSAVEPRAIISGSGDRRDSAPLPDLAFYRSQPPARFDWMRRPPEMVAEILSPGQTRVSMRAKVDLYQSFGVRCILVFDPERELVDRYEGGELSTLALDDTLTLSVAPGFAVTVRDLLYRPE